MESKILTSTVQSHALPLRSTADIDQLLLLIGDAEWVLLGEATHGTTEFYTMRMEITKALIEKKGFHAVCLEADWPDVARVNRFIQNAKTADSNSWHALGDFTRFPQWMWANSVMVDLVGWLATYNTKKSDEKKVGIYGLDLYSLFSSIDKILEYLDNIDQSAAQRARLRYNCFAQYRHDIAQYGFQANTLNISASCQAKVLEQLLDLHNNSLELLRADGKQAINNFFDATRNAQLIISAEKYYRSLFTAGQETSWNLRDIHMTETAHAIAAHLISQGVPKPKLIIWAHNSHIGNAAATQMGQMGEINVGQLIKERHGSKSFLVGFTTYSGTVTAASTWQGSALKKELLPALDGSYEKIFHETKLNNFLLPIKDTQKLKESLRGPLLERAIGVIYSPSTERASHYFTANLAQQFDAVIHLDQTSALEPLHKKAEWSKDDLPDTYPSGI